MSGCSSRVRRPAGGPWRATTAPPPTASPPSASALDHWAVDAASITRRRGEDELPLDMLDLVLDLRETLGLEGERLGFYLEEISSTLSASAYKLALPPLTADELAAADFQTIEARMTEGHPCFVANSGRLGFDATDYRRYAPEAAAPVQLVWVAAHRDWSTFSASADLDYDALLAAELGRPTLERFACKLEALGLDLADYHLIPAHPWQWSTRLAVTFAADVARRRLVCLGPGDDEYLAQQSIRTFFNVSEPARHYVKTALSVVNMGFVRGLSAAYMEGTPAINDWVADQWPRTRASRSCASARPSATAASTTKRRAGPTRRCSPRCGARAPCRGSRPASGSRRWPRCCTSTATAARWRRR